MTTKKRPLRMTVTQAAVHAAFDIAHQRVLEAEANADSFGYSDLDPRLLSELIDALRARAVAWDKLWSAYESSTFIHAHLRLALMAAAHNDRKTADKFAAALKGGE